MKSSRSTIRFFRWEVDTESLAVFFLMACFVFLLPDLAMAAGDRYGPSASLETDVISSARRWWRLVANLAVIGGIVAAIIMYFFYPKFLGVAVIIALIGGFGESVVSWILSIGGGSDMVINTGR